MWRVAFVVKSTSVPGLCVCGGGANLGNALWSEESRNQTVHYNSLSFMRTLIVSSLGHVESVEGRGQVSSELAMMMMMIVIITWAKGRYDTLARRLREGKGGTCRRRRRVTSRPRATSRAANRSCLGLKWFYSNIVIARSLSNLPVGFPMMALFQNSWKDFCGFC